MSSSDRRLVYEFLMSFATGAFFCFALASLIKVVSYLL